MRLVELALGYGRGYKSLATLGGAGDVGGEYHFVKYLSVWTLQGWFAAAPHRWTSEAHFPDDAMPLPRSGLTRGGRFSEYVVLFEIAPNHFQFVVLPV